MRITMVGHSTVLIEVLGLRILTDPFFGTWGNPAYARLRPPGQTREELQDVDLVLVSHNHWDHTDRRYLSGLSDSVPVLAPKRATLITKAKGARKVVGMRPWDRWATGGVEIHAVPALHSATAVGFVVQISEGSLYFAGDTYFRPFIEEIGRRFRPDIALLPVTTYRIPMTMGEKGAVKAALALQASVFIPIHLGLQPRAPFLRTRQSPERFAMHLAGVLPTAEVLLLKEGESWSAT